MYSFAEIGVIITAFNSNDLEESSIQNGRNLGTK